MRFHSACTDTLVPRLGGADEIIIGAVEGLQHLAEHGGVPVRQLNRRDAFLDGRLLHFLAMLVCAGQEKHILALQPRKPRQNIGRNGRVGVADMGHAVGIEDRGCKVILLGHCGLCLFN